MITNVATKHNCTVDESMEKRTAVPDDALEAILGVKDSMSSFVRVVFVGQRAKIARSDLEDLAAKFSTSTTNAVSNGTAYGVGAAIESERIRFVLLSCDAAALPTMKASSADLSKQGHPVSIETLENYSPEVVFSFFTHGTVKTSPNEGEQKADGSMDGNVVIKITVRESPFRNDIIDNFYNIAVASKGASATFVAMDFVDDYQCNDRDFLMFLSKKFGPVKLTYNEHTCVHQILYSKVLPSQIEGVHSIFMTRMQKKSEGACFVRISPAKYTRLKEQLESYLVPRCEFYYDGEWLEINAHSNTLPPHTYRTPSSWLMAVVSAAVAYNDIKERRKSGSIFSPHLYPARDTLPYVDDKAAAELILMHQVCIKSKSTFACDSALHAASTFGRYFRGGSRVEARDLSVTVLYLAHKASKETKLRSLSSVVTLYYNTVYPNNSMRKEELTVILERVINLEAKIISQLEFKVTSDHGKWVIAKMKKILLSASAASESFSKYLGHATTVYLSGQILALEGGSFISRYNCETVASACYALFDRDPQRLKALLMSMNVDASKVAACAATILQGFKPLTNKKYKDHVEVAGLLSNAAKMGVFSLPSELLSPRTTQLSATGKICVNLNGLSGKILGDPHFLAKIESISEVTTCEATVVQRPEKIGFIEVIGSVRQVAVFVEFVNRYLKSFPHLEHITMQTTTFDLNQLQDTMEDEFDGLGAHSSMMEVTDIRAEVPSFSVLDPTNVPFSVVMKKGLAWATVPLKFGLGTSQHLLDLECWKDESRIQEQNEVVQYLLGGKMDSDCDEELHLSRWPPTTLAAKEVLKLENMEGTQFVKSFGFSPVALQDLSLLHKIHLQEGGEHPNFLLPVGVLYEKKAEGERIISRTRKSETDTNSDEDDDDNDDDDDVGFDIDNLGRKSTGEGSSGSEKRIDRKKIKREAEKKKRRNKIREARAAVMATSSSDGSRSNAPDVKSSLHFINKITQPFTLSILQRRFLKTKTYVPSSTLPLSVVRVIFWDLLRILKALHMNDICVGKLDSAGVLLGGDGRLQMSSVAGGVSWSSGDDLINVQESSKKVKISGSNLPLSAPEILLGSTKFTPKTDIWLVASMVTSLLLGKHVFAAKDRVSMLLVVSKMIGSLGTSNFSAGVRLPFYKEYKHSESFKKYKPGVAKALEHMLGEKKGDCADFIDLISRMLVLDPAKRIDADKALQHELFTGDKGWRQFSKDWCDTKGVLDGVEQTRDGGEGSSGQSKKRSEEEMREGSSSSNRLDTSRKEAVSPKRMKSDELGLAAGISSEALPQQENIPTQEEDLYADF